MLRLDQVGGDDERPDRRPEQRSWVLIAGAVAAPISRSVINQAADEIAVAETVPLPSIPPCGCCAGSSRGEISPSFPSDLK